MIVPVSVKLIGDPIICAPWIPWAKGRAKLMLDAGGTLQKWFAPVPGVLVQIRTFDGERAAILIRTERQVGYEFAIKLSRLWHDVSDSNRTRITLVQLDAANVPHGLDARGGPTTPLVDVGPNEESDAFLFGGRKSQRASRITSDPTRATYCGNGIAALTMQDDGGGADYEMTNLIAPDMPGAGGYLFNGLW